ncbi:hypothetical protein [Oceaniglobus ichthyenteri]|uniref:hypothetical protein n=1 Tax=Oceaniglobus ichthyenteri TaxID=2136177 RepID=UPI000D368B77|nr:hypothetical protein [Oceaniglobus ichthyenteri]
MKTLLIIAVLAAGTTTLTAIPAQAGAIERACLKSDRRAASRSLCGCIQGVADLTLSRQDQRLAAKFFRDPHQSQVVRQSDNSNHETFWKKYRQFGNTAKAYCS